MHKILILLIFTIIISASCTPLKLVSDHQKGVSFEKYNTYQLDVNKSVFPKDANPINHVRLEEIINLKMQELGFEASENPDFHIQYFVKKEMKETVLHKGEDPDDLDYKYLYEVFTYKEGSLVVDFIEAGTNKALWHGVLTRTVDENMKTAEKRINRNVDAIFKKFTNDVQLK